MRFDYEKYYDNNESRYYEEKEQAFKDFMVDMIVSFMNKTDVDDMTSENFAEYLEDFEFPDIDEWMGSEYQGMIDMYNDSKYEQWKDERMGL